MCGIVGIIHLEKNLSNNTSALENAVQSLNKRGPDRQATFWNKNIGIGHARLSILDTTDAGTQPMHSHDGAYTIVFNGEIYNYREIKDELEGYGEKFTTGTDTEVLLAAYIHWGKEVLQKLNGFFSFAILKKDTNELFIARDRMGIKPLLYYQDQSAFIFASEFKAIHCFSVEKELNINALQFYLQLNYIPGPLSIFKGVKKLMPGHYMEISAEGKVNKASYYQLEDVSPIAVDYEQAKNSLKDKLEKAVVDRMIADVPLGTFLSGGIDSSIISAIAAKHTAKLNTFSIGYKDEPLFDETSYANLVAKRIKSDHTVFSLSNEDLYEHVFDILDYIDEPFADSSAIAVYILCERTQQSVTVALSGDGADEIFAGYNKHYAEYKARNGGLLKHALMLAEPVFSVLPQSRNSKMGNLFRQAHRFAEGAKMDDSERYFKWCSFVGLEEAKALLKREDRTVAEEEEYLAVKGAALSSFTNGGDYREMLLADQKLVLVNDMLVKVDMMSMANSLEVRVPFLDHNLVNYVNSLPTEYKIDNKGFRKKILKDAYRDVLPAELYDRPKHGFEVPLLKWFKTGLRSLIEDDLLKDSFIEEQGVFNLVAIKELKRRLFSSSPGDVHAQIWGLIVFQYWWKKYMN